MAHAIHADGGEYQDAGIQVWPGDLQQFDPQPHQRQVQHQQDDVADVQRRHQCPDQVGGGFEQHRPRLQVVVLERGQQDRCGSGRRDAQGQQRHQRPGRAGVVGRFRAGDAFDGALALVGGKLLGVLAELALGGIGQKGRNLRAAGRNRTKRKADQRAAKPRRHRTLPVGAAHP
ncbi:hypothetical protein D3C75_890810 [compost metagenome]